MYTKPLKKVTIIDSSSAGGKGASLGEMLNVGISIPDGFVILAEAFTDFVLEKKLFEKITLLLNQIDYTAADTIHVASKLIKQLITEQDLPTDLKAELTEQLNMLNSKFVAIRSSAIAEDGTQHAWAGQLESYLNIPKEMLFANIKNCWASFFTSRALLYRFEKKILDTPFVVAVIVQKMINAEKSGVAFSVHPVTKNKDHMIIEAGLGLGESIVSGSITPDSYIVGKEHGRLVSMVNNKQNRALYTKKDGGVEWKEIQTSTQVLSDQEINELGNIIVQIETHFGFPCDIEWTFELGTFYITQSRPITTLSDFTNDKK
jgi:phosphoenolpyruvate synthase/pyruvate phosphate dikinase